MAYLEAASPELCGDLSRIEQVSFLLNHNVSEKVMLTDSCFSYEETKAASLDFKQSRQAALYCGKICELLLSFDHVFSKTVIENFGQPQSGERQFLVDQINVGLVVRFVNGRRLWVNNVTRLIV